MSEQTQDSFPGMQAAAFSSEDAAAPAPGIGPQAPAEPESAPRGKARKARAAQPAGAVATLPPPPAGREEERPDVLPEVGDKVFYWRSAGAGSAATLQKLMAFVAGYRGERVNLFVVNSNGTPRAHQGVRYSPRPALNCWTLEG